MTGDFSEYNENVIKLQADLLAMTAFIRAQNNSKIGKVATASQEAAAAAVDLATSFVPINGTVSDADLGILSEYQNQVKNYLEDGIIDLAKESLFHGKYNGSIDSAIADIKLALKGFGSVLHGLEIGLNTIKGVMTAVYMLKFTCADELKKAYEYFDGYLMSRTYYERPDDPAFQNILSALVGGNIVGGTNDFDAFLQRLGIPNLESIVPVLNTWAEYIYKVEKCIAEKNNILSNTNHRWSVVFTEIAESGLETVCICSVCGYRQMETPPITVNCTHDSVSKVSTRQPSCTESGYEGYWVCMSCGKKFSDANAQIEIASSAVIPALKHNPSNQWSSDVNYHWHACQNNQAEQLDKAEHSWNKGVVTTPATCAKDGEKTYTCTACGKIKTEVISALGHAASDEWTSDETYHWHVCRNNQAEQLDKAEHSWNEGVVTTLATCVKDGEKTYTCTACGKIKTEVISALGHAASDEWTSDETYHWHVCQNNQAEQLDKKEHTWDEGVITVRPTQMQTGEKTYTCIICGGTKVEEVVKLPSFQGDDQSGDNGHVISVISVVENGSIVVDTTRAGYNELVTVIATPDAGYKLSELTVYDENNNMIAVSDKGNGIYTFVMPNEAVSINATFVRLENPEVDPGMEFSDVNQTDWFYDSVQYVSNKRLMTGTADDQFSPNATTTRAMVVTILYRLEGEPAVTGDAHFTDLVSGQYYLDAVAWASQNDIVNGVGENTFAPNEDITREQMATILYRYAQYKGLDVSTAADLSGYPDAAQVQTYAQKAMSWAVAEGIVAGMDDGTLNPAGNASRAQIATILMRFCESVAQ